MYVVAIDMRPNALTTPLQEWWSQLEAIASSIAPESLEDMRAECTTANQHRKQLVRMKSKKWVAQRQAVRGTPKWIAQHQAARDALGLPNVAELKAKTLAHSPAANCLPPRMLDLLGMHWEIALRHGVQPQAHNFIWDLTNSVRFKCKKDPKTAGILPCALRNHKCWATKWGVVH